MAGGEFLAQIRMAITGQQEVKSALADTQQSMERLSATQVAVPGLDKVSTQAQTADKAVSGITAAFAGFTEIGKKTTQTYDNLGNVVGSKVTQTFRNQAGVIGNVVTQYGKAGEIIKRTAFEEQKAAGGMNEFVLAMKRAFIVAPVWMAVRGLMTGVQEGIRDGIKYLVEFEDELSLIEQTLRRTGGEDGIGKLRKSLEAIGEATAKGPKEAGAAYIEFRKVINDDTAALAGAKEAISLQDVAMSKDKAIVTALALAYQTYGDSMDASMNSQQKMQMLAAQFQQTAATNRITVGELTKEYISFKPAADSMGLSLSQTLAIIGQLNTQGISQIPQLKSGLIKLFSEPQKYAKDLGLEVTRDTDSFSLIIAMLQKIKTVAGTGVVPKSITDLLGASGGGKGGLLGLKELAQAPEKIVEAWKSLNTSETVSKYNDDVTSVNERLSKQQEILQHLGKETWSKAIETILGREEHWHAGLEALNQFLEKRFIPTLDAAANSKFFTLPVPRLLEFIGEIKQIVDLGEKAKRGEKLTDIEKATVKNIMNQYGIKPPSKPIAPGITVGETGVGKEQENTEERRTQTYIKNGQIVDSNLVKTKQQIAFSEAMDAAEKRINATLAEGNRLRSDAYKTEESLILKLAQSSGFEKNRIKRTMELMVMSGESLAAMSSSGGLDARLIRENYSHLTPEQQAKVLPAIAASQGVSSFLPKVSQPETQKLPNQVTQNANFGGITISVNPDSLENMSAKSAEQLRATLEADPALRKFLTKIVLNENTGGK